MKSRGLRSAPQWLFRVSSDQSNGVNTPELFMPALLSRLGLAEKFGLRYDPWLDPLQIQVINALHDHPAIFNPFIFLTNSMLYALQHADRKAKGHKAEWEKRLEKHKSNLAKRREAKMKEAQENGTQGEIEDELAINTQPDLNAGEAKHDSANNVQIHCICTATAATPSGKKVQFQSVKALMKKLGIRPLKAKRTNLVMDYSDVFITTDSIVPGPGSYTVSLDALLDNGLLALFPEIDVNMRLKNPGLETPARHFRRVVQTRRDLTRAQFNVAAELAMAFTPVKGLEEEQVREYLFSWFLALRNQDPSGSQLDLWLERYSSPGTTAPSDDHGIHRSDRIEVHRNRDLYQVIGKRRLRTGSWRDFWLSIHLNLITARRLRYKRLRRDWNRQEKQRLLEEERARQERKENKLATQRAKAAVDIGQESVEEDAVAEMAPKTTPALALDVMQSANTQREHPETVNIKDRGPEEAQASHVL